MPIKPWVLLVAVLAIPAVSWAQAAPESRRIPLEGSPSSGPADAPATIVEFIDFLSPRCQAAGALLGRIREARPGKVRLVIKFLPGESREAYLAAVASLAAGAQGKYWEMHDLLLAVGARRDREGLVALAGNLGLDAGRFAADLDGMRHVERLEQDKMLAVSLNVAEVPTFLLNGHRIAGTPDFAAFTAAVDEELARAPH